MYCILNSAVRRVNGNVHQITSTICFFLVYSAHYYFIKKKNALIININNIFFIALQLLHFQGKYA